MRKEPVHPRAVRLEILARELVSGARRFHELPPDLTADEAADVRRRALAEIRGTTLDHLGRYTLDATRASTRHCENFIGAAQVPIGIVGPLPVRGEVVREDVLVPLATTEGALLASVNRGCRALAASGGAAARAEDVGMTRAPVFRTSGLEQTGRFLAWVREHEPELREVAESTSRHLKLQAIRPSAFGTTVFLRFRFSTGDAMGMNMATIACDRVIRQVVEPGTGVRCVALSGNYCVDKKPAAINFQEGRGKRIFSEARFGGAVLEEVLGTNAPDLLEVQYRKNLLGSIAAGALGYNAHYANVLAAFFIATGQDLAHVVGGAMGVTCVEPDGGDGVVVSVFLPDVPLGAVGGGTALETQREVLALLGVRPAPEAPGRATVRMAEILGATVLAGEISLLAAFTTGALSGAHERFARGDRPAGDAGP